MQPRVVSQSISSPAAEIVVDCDLVRSLLGAQHPDISELPLEEAAAGWDNFTYRLGAEMAIRLPRRTAAALQIQHEQKWLPVIAENLPLPVPSPLRLGKPDNRYPWPWSILPWLKGETADLTPIRDDQARRFARFLRALHIPAPADGPKNPSRGVPLTQRAASVEERMHRLEQKTSLINSIVWRAWNSGLQAVQDEHPTWIHGDLHPRNVLVQRGALSGIIDWADIAAGDRATDLASIWLLLPTIESREAAISEYGKVPSAIWFRAVGWAILFGVLLLETGLVDNPVHAKIGAVTLQRLADGPHLPAFLS
jgi:aminoglycoside phosphotransferase (APT) family kinase protein